MIKIIILFTGFLTLLTVKVGAITRLSAEQVKARIDVVMKQLPTLLANDPTGDSAQKMVNHERLIIDTIQSYFYDVPGALHENTPERLKRIRQVEGWLFPYEGQMIRVLSASQQDGQIPNAIIDLIAFTKPTPRVHDALLSIARNDSANPQNAAEAYDAIFMLGLDDAAVRREVVEKIGWRNEPETRSELGMNLLIKSSSYWAMSELEDLYRAFLSVPYKPENYPSRGGRAKLQSQYDIAIRGLKAFGTLGASFADLLKARLAEMDPTEDSDRINSCQETILIVEGKCIPKPVVSWKGYFLGVSKNTYPVWVAGHQTSTIQSSKSTGTITSQKQSSQVKAARSSEKLNQSLNTVSRVPWIMWITLIGVMVCLVWLLLKSRK